jgi:DNA-binding NtrC family response regulator
MREGLFREDLFYRLSVFPIRLPPLRERKEDIPLLVGHFLEKFNRETGKGIRGLSHDAMRAAMDYCWPGNVRELENAIEHAFVTCEGDEISLFDLPQEIRRAEYRRAECRDAMRARLARVPDRQGLLDLLRECDWNKAEVARRLGVSRAAVWKRMRRLGIPSGPDSAG